MTKENEAPASSNQETSPPAGVEVAPEDRKRNWNEDTTMSLVRAWQEVAKGGKTTMYNEPCTMSTRYNKAIEDKMQALREMNRVISDVHANCIQGSAGKAEWFELSRKEKKELRDLHRIKSPNVSATMFSELHRFLNDKADMVPLSSSYSTQPRFAEQSVEVAPGSSDDADCTLANDDNGGESSRDLFNSGRKSSKNRRNDNVWKCKNVVLSIGLGMTLPIHALGFESHTKKLVIKQCGLWLRFHGKR
ncbi:Hypothetical protein PHPALM_19914 [Phytophthora palmivora]|uniref:Uncharacterized protein n=1 Tax=Phytophthora palmivora TaxID=4796 RepID=A0A2P4XG60_9STRA|nr:Hypothetical protein PHPALM_19914 [Phytophthora palmivora]